MPGSVADTGATKQRLTARVNLLPEWQWQAEMGAWRRHHGQPEVVRVCGMWPVNKGSWLEQAVGLV